MRDKDKHPEALKEFFKAITYSKKANDNKLTGYIYNNIANIYLSQRLHEQADSIYQITEKLAIQEKDSNLWADVLSQRGMIKPIIWTHEYGRKSCQICQTKYY